MAKLYHIYTSADKKYLVEGDVITVDAVTGVSCIYEGLNTHYTKIVAVIPNGMLIIAYDLIKPDEHGKD
jgi:hypothetical protein